jgi:hypothetical protein
VAYHRASALWAQPFDLPGPVGGFGDSGLGGGGGAGLGGVGGVGIFIIPSACLVEALA